MRSKKKTLKERENKARTYGELEEKYKIAKNC